MKNLFKSKALIILMSSLFVLGCTASKEKPELTSATLLPTAKQVGSIKLKHFSDGDFNNKSIEGQWSLFFFGYTRCPDVCPTELYMLSEVMGLIEKTPASVQQVPQVVFVSVDPQQDKLKALDEYAGYYHPSFKGVTGKQSDVDQLVKTMGAFYERAYILNNKILEIEDKDDIPDNLKDSYLISHSASIILTNPKGEMHAVFSQPHVPATVVDDLNKIQKAW